MLNSGVRAGVHTSATFNAFFDIFYDSFSIHYFKNLYRAGSDTFPSSFALIVINSYDDVSFFKFLFHGRSSLL